VEVKLHRTIRQVTEQLADLQYNTSIAALMEYLNAVRTGGRKAARSEVEPLVPMVAPFCPHIAEELWARLGHSGSIFDGGQWPTWDEAKTRASSIEVAVQVNGKLRGSIVVEPGIDQAAAEATARSTPNVARHLEGVTIRKVIFVQDRLLNFVVG